MTELRNLAVGALILGCCAPVLAGVSVGGTRFVYAERAKGLKVELRNNGAESSLINTHITRGGSWQGVAPSAEKVPFIVTPPLFAIKGNKESSIRIIKTPGELPRDRESLFTLSIAGIPSGGAGSNTVQIAVRSLLKLFYRPAGLTGSPQQAYKQLRWTTSQGKTHLSNPTPWYVTLVNLQVNGKRISDAGMIAPFSQREANWCPTSTPCNLSWQSINDYGRLLPVVSRSVY